MSYCFFNRQKLLQNAKHKYHDCGGKEKAATYYIQLLNMLLNISFKRKCKK